MKILLKGILFSAILCLTLFVVIYGNILTHAKRSTPEKSDVMIVLGCQVWGDSPSWSLEYRLEKALELYKNDYAGYIIVSGGQGEDEAASEASVMKNWLVAHGVDEDKIMEEDKSTSTYENLKYSKKLMDERKMETTIIVSNDFHIFRSLRIAKRLGIKASGAPAPSVRHSAAYYCSREVVSVIKSFLVDR